MHYFQMNGITGCIDRLTADRLEGWAWCSEHPGQPVIVQLMLDEWIVRHVEATLYRPDLLEAGIGNGHHGFILPLLSQEMEARPGMLRVAVDSHVIEGFSVPINHLDALDSDSLVRMIFGSLLSHKNSFNRE